MKDFIPEGRSNRPGHELLPQWITVHDTANPSADALDHAKYLKGDAERDLKSWHFTVDDQRIIQHLPLDEVGWHAGDRGNPESIGIEICEFGKNEDAKRAKAEENAARLIAHLLHQLNLGSDRVVTHQRWTGKECPRVLLPRWYAFLEQIEQIRGMPIVEQMATVRFDVLWPVQVVSVTTAHRFELRFDDDPKVVLSSMGGQQREHSARIFLWPGSHTARVRYWAPQGAAQPAFSERPWMPGDAPAVEPPSGAPVPMSYSLVANPAAPRVSDRVVLAYSAREPATNQEIVTVELSVDGRIVHRSFGSEGSWVWPTAGLPAGTHHIRLQARLAGGVSAEGRDFTLFLQPQADSQAGPAHYILFALPHAQANWDESNIPVSFSIAQSALESGWGRSGLATRYHNYFGIKCPGSPEHKQCVTLDGAAYRAYNNPRESFIDHGRFLRQNPRYRLAFQHMTDPEAFAREVAQAGYAEDPAYLDKIVRIMQDHNLAQYDRGQAE